MMMAVEQAQMGSLTRDVLGESDVYLDSFGVDKDQSFSAGKSALVATLTELHTRVERSVCGEGTCGVGVPLNALVRALFDENPSLSSLRFHSFELEGVEENRWSKAHQGRALALGDGSEFRD